MTSKFAAAAALIVLTLVAYSSLWSNDFVNFDDPDYVTTNPWVQRGLSWSGIRWAVTSDHAKNWHPLTWFSHMADWQFFGDNAAGHHAVNLAWHLAAGLLLFWTLTRMTGAIWPSALVAAIFLLHPLQVESVAWTAQRKSVLSAFFWMLTIAGYARYAESSRLGWYGAVVVAFGLALIAKPMVVTLPFVLLLLDFWPLKRAFQSQSGRQTNSSRWLLVEKLPMLLLTIAVSIVTYYVQDTSKSDIAVLPLSQRLGNAVVSYAEYVRLLFWPSSLAVLYPHPRGALPYWKIAAAAAFIALVTIIAWKCRATRPYLLVGWLWYLGTLVPMIGIIQVGRQSHADRYAYIPIVGIGLMLAYSLADVANRYRRMPPVAMFLACLWLFWLTPFTDKQVRIWHDSETLFSHTLYVTRNNGLAHYLLGVELGRQGRRKEAIGEMRSALAIEPGEYNANVAIASFLVQEGKYQDALNELNQALKTNGNVADTYYRRGELRILLGEPALALADFERARHLDTVNVAARVGCAEAKLRLGQTDAAKLEFEAILNDDSPNIAARNGLGVIAVQAGQMARAQKHFEDALDLEPRAIDPRRNLAVLYLRQGEEAKAYALLADGFVVHHEDATRNQFVGILMAENRSSAAVNLLRNALTREPDNFSLANNLAWILATTPGMTAVDRQESLRWATKAVEATDSGNDAYLDTLAAAQAASGHFATAVKTAELVIERAQQFGNTALKEQVRQRLELYRQGKPYVAIEPKR